MKLLKGAASSSRVDARNVPFEYLELPYSKVSKVHTVRKATMTVRVRVRLRVQCSYSNHSRNWLETLASPPPRARLMNLVSFFSSPTLLVLRSLALVGKPLPYRSPARTNRTLCAFPAHPRPCDRRRMQWGTRVLAAHRLCSFPPLSHAHAHPASTYMPIPRRTRSV